MIWLDRDLQWSGLASGKRGRPSLFSDAAIQFCLTIKGLFGLALRQAMGMVESLLKLAGLSWSVPDYSTVCRRQKTLKVRIPYRPAAQGLHLLVDSTGVKMMGEGEWKRKKHGAEYRRQWRKLHIGIDAQTMEIRAIEVTPNSVGDAPVLPSAHATNFDNTLQLNSFCRRRRPATAPNRHEQDRARPLLGRRPTSRRMDLAPLQVKPSDMVDGARTAPEPELLARPFNVGTLLLFGEFIGHTQRNLRWDRAWRSPEIMRPVDLRILPHALTQGLDGALGGVGRGLEPIAAQPGDEASARGIEPEPGMDAVEAQQPVTAPSDSVWHAGRSDAPPLLRCPGQA
jgi:IS5 family transposase